MAARKDVEADRERRPGTEVPPVSFIEREATANVLNRVEVKVGGGEVGRA